MEGPWVSVVPYALGLAAIVALVRTARLREREPGLALRQRIGLLLATFPLFLLLGVGLTAFPAITQGAQASPAPSEQLAQKALLHGFIYFAVPALGVGLVLGREGISQAVRKRLAPGGPQGLARALNVGTAWAGLLALGALAVSVVSDGYDGLLAAEGAKLFFSNTTPGVALGLAAAAALAEELLFRGVLLDGLRRRMPTNLAVGLQAVAFGSIHAGYGSLAHVAAATAFGLLAGVLVVRYGLVPALVTHFVVNLAILAYWSGHYALLAPALATLLATAGLAWILDGSQKAWRPAGPTAAGE